MLTQMNPIQNYIEEDKKIEKWLTVLQNWDKIIKKQKSIIKNGVRMGIPDLLRGKVWIYLTGSHIKPDEDNLESYIRALETQDCDYENTILNDIHRTFPKHPLFNSYTGDGQTSLYNILRAFAIKNPDVGYCQGMGFISAIFLTYLDEETSFWMLHHVVKKYQLQGYFSTSMSSLKSAFYKLQVLMKKIVPKLHSNFVNHKIQPTMYASQWFLTLFAVNFSFEIISRIWDIYLLEGEKTIYRFGIAILLINQSDLLEDEFDKVMNGLKKMYRDIDINNLFKTALNIKITNTQLQSLQSEFNDNPDPEVTEFLLF